MSGKPAVTLADDKAPDEDRKRIDFLFWLGVAIVSGVVFLAIFGPAVAPYDPTLASHPPSQPPPPLSQWPSLLWLQITGGLEKTPYWFGTDATGFDLFSRVISAPRVDLTIALTANILSLILGITLGLVAGYWRNLFTEGMMRVSDVLQSFPVFISAMILVALAGRSTTNIVIALAMLYTPIYIRLTRSEVLSQRVRGYVEAARAMGNSEMSIALRHVMPNSLAPALIQSSVTIGFAILLTAGLSFVGAGVRPPAPEWGLMISSGANQIVLGEWWPSVFPGVAISLTVFGFAALGNAMERRYEA